MELALESLFRLFIYVVAALVILFIIFNFRQVAERVQLPCFWCKKEVKCETVVVEEQEVTEGVLKKYCELCWHRTAALELREDCLCYAIKAREESLPSLKHERCELRCGYGSFTFLVQYKWLDKKVIIEC